MKDNLKSSQTNVFLEFHNWLKTRDFQPCYPDAFKIFDFAQQFPELLKLPSQSIYDCNTYNRAEWLYEQYEAKRNYFLKLDFWKLCRQWRGKFGKKWIRMFKKGYETGKHFSGDWYPMIVDLKSRENDPSDYGYALGRNAIILERR